MTIGGMWKTYYWLEAKELGKEKQIEEERKYCLFRNKGITLLV